MDEGQHKLVSPFPAPPEFLFSNILNEPLAPPSLDFLDIVGGQYSTFGETHSQESSDLSSTVQGTSDEVPIALKTQGTPSSFRLSQHSLLERDIPKAVSQLSRNILDIYSTLLQNLSTKDYTEAILHESLQKIHSNFYDIQSLLEKYRQFQAMKNIWLVLQSNMSMAMSDTSKLQEILDCSILNSKDSMSQDHH